MSKVLLKNTVHLGKMRHVVEENIDLDDLLDRCVGFFQNRQDVLAALGGFVRDAAVD